MYNTYSSIWQTLSRLYRSIAEIMPLEWGVGTLSELFNTSELNTGIA